MPANSLEVIITGGLTLLALVVYQAADLLSRARGAWHDFRYARAESADDTSL